MTCGMRGSLKMCCRTVASDGAGEFLVPGPSIHSQSVLVLIPKQRSNLSTINSVGQTTLKLTDFNDLYLSASLLLGLRTSWAGLALTPPCRLKAELS